MEQARGAGVFVVVAAGNDPAAPLHLDSAAMIPDVVAVGAADQLSDPQGNSQAAAAVSGAATASARPPSTVGSSAAALIPADPLTTIGTLCPPDTTRCENGRSGIGRTDIEDRRIDPVRTSRPLRRPRGFPVRLLSPSL